MNASKRERVSAVVRSGLEGGDYAVSRAVLFGSLVHNGRTPADIDLMIEFSEHANVRHEAERIKEQVGTSLEVFGLPVHWEWFRSDDQFALARFLKRCEDRGGYVEVWRGEAVRA